MDPGEQFLSIWRWQTLIEAVKGPKMGYRQAENPVE